MPTTDLQHRQAAEVNLRRGLVVELDAVPVSLVGFVRAADPSVGLSS